MDYVPFRSLARIFNAGRKKEPLRRRDAVIGSIEAAVSSSALLWAMFGLRRALLAPPSIEDVSAVAEYIDGNICRLQDFSGDRGLPIVYFLPDLHYTGIHQLHVRMITSLRDSFGLKFVGMESRSNDITAGLLEDEFRQIMEYGKPMSSQLERNQAKHEGRDPVPYTTLDEFLDQNPLLRFAYDPNFVLFGLEDEHTGQQRKHLKELEMWCKGYYPYAKEYEEIQTGLKTGKERIKSDQLLIDMDEIFLKQVEDPLERKKREQELERRKSELQYDRELYVQLVDASSRELPKYRKIFEEFRARMDPIREKLDAKYSLPDYDEGIADSPGVLSTPFMETLTRHIDAIATQRSLDAVRIALERTRNQPQVCLVFGSGHRAEIVEELNQRNTSFIVFYGSSE